MCYMQDLPTSSHCRHRDASHRAVSYCLWRLLVVCASRKAVGVLLLGPRVGLACWLAGVRSDEAGSHAVVAVRLSVCHRPVTAAREHAMAATTYDGWWLTGRSTGSQARPLHGDDVGTVCRSVGSAKPRSSTPHNCQHGISQPVTTLTRVQHDVVKPCNGRGLRKQLPACQHLLTLHQAGGVRLSLIDCSRPARRRTRICTRGTRRLDLCTVGRGGVQTMSHGR